MITLDRLNQLLIYCPETGQLKWLESRGSVSIGTVASNTNNHGYVTVRVDGTRYLAHRLAWLQYYGELPVNCIDHINGIRTDNRIVNLREATVSGNNCNRKIGSNNKTGVKGVYIEKRTCKYVAQIKIDYKIKHLGTFDSLDEASQALETTRTQLHGEFARN